MMNDKTIRPRNALLHPVWLVALALLVFNDHFLKASELLPALSGKLSDFVGLLVAPVLLAVVLGVKSRRGLWLSAVAVGLVFGAINTSPSIAAAWDAMVSTVVPFHTTVDPTDLVALTMLPLGLLMFGPAMRAELDRSRLRRTIQLALAVFGVAMCTATSMDETCATDDDCPFSGDICVDEWCEAPPEDEMNASTGGSSTMSELHPMDDLEAEALDEQSLFEIDMRPVRSLDPALRGYLEDDALPITH